MDRLLSRKTETVNVEGQVMQIRELSAREVFAVWDLVKAAEHTQDKARLYYELLHLGLRGHDGRAVFQNADEVADLPSRIVIPLAERIMAISEIGMEEPAGNA